MAEKEENFFSTEETLLDLPSGDLRIHASSDFASTMKAQHSGNDFHHRSRIPGRDEGDEGPDEHPFQGEDSRRTRKDPRHLTSFDGLLPHGQDRVA